MHVFMNWVFIYIFIFSKHRSFLHECVTNMEKRMEYHITFKIATPNKLFKKADYKHVSVHSK